jgi:hypothetical protein
VCQSAAAFAHAVRVCRFRSPVDGRNREKPNTECNRLTQPWRDRGGASARTLADARPTARRIARPTCFLGDPSRRCMFGCVTSLPTLSASSTRIVGNDVTTPRRASHAAAAAASASASAQQHHEATALRRRARCQSTGGVERGQTRSKTARCR